LILQSEFAYIGSNQLGEGVQRKVVATFMHPGYNPNTSANDFMIVKLDGPVPDIEPLKLNADPSTPGLITINRANAQNQQDRQIEVGELLTVIGFGVLAEGDVVMASTMQEAFVPFIPLADCQAWYRDEAIDGQTMFCAGYQNGGVDACQGDSGAPILNEDGIAVGVVSWGQVSSMIAVVFGLLSVWLYWCTFIGRLFKKCFSRLSFY
jgi:secreted trypsin-like serine protease